MISFLSLLRILPLINSFSVKMLVVYERHWQGQRACGSEVNLSLRVLGKGTVFHPDGCMMAMLLVQKIFALFFKKKFLLKIMLLK